VNIRPWLDPTLDLSLDETHDPGGTQLSTFRFTKHTPARESSGGRHRIPEWSRGQYLNHWMTECSAVHQCVAVESHFSSLRSFRESDREHCMPSTHGYPCLIYELMLRGGGILPGTAALTEQLSGPSIRGKFLGDSPAAFSQDTDAGKPGAGLSKRVYQASSPLCHDCRICPNTLKVPLMPQLDFTYSNKKPTLSTQRRESFQMG
jgi:hypothetical protein